MLYTQSSGEEKELENIIFAFLHRSLGSDDKIFYYNENAAECDFLIQKGEDLHELVQVCWELTAENRSREIKGLTEASKATGCHNCRIITYEQEETIHQDGLTISVVPAWRL